MLNSLKSRIKNVNKAITCYKHASDDGLCKFPDKGAAKLSYHFTVSKRVKSVGLLFSMAFIYYERLRSSCI